MAKSRYEELLNMAHSATNGAGAAFSRDEQGNTYVDTYTGNGQERQQVAFTPDKPVEERHSKYEELLNMAYHATGGEGAAFSRDEQGNVYVTPWEATKKRTEETQAANAGGGVYKQEDMSTVDKAVDSLLGVDRTQVTGEKTNWWQLLKGTVSKGLNQWNSLNWKSVDFLFGDLAEDLHALGTETVNGVIEALNYIPGVNLKYIGQDSKNLVEWGNEDAQAGLQQATEKYAANANSSRAAQIVDKFGTSTVAAVPMALEAILLAPAQAAQAGAATTAGLQYFSGLQSAAGMEAAVMMAKQGLTKLVQNPQFWTSYLQVAGDGYESALEDGMSEEDAGLYGLVNGFFNAMVEIGGADEALGGIQNLPMRLQQQGGKHAVVEWFKEAVLGEASEEVIQGLTERGLLQGMQGDSVGEMFSLDPANTRAAFNPWTAAQEAIGGGVVGAVLGGGQTAINKAVTGGMNAAADAITTRQEQREQAAQETGRQYVQQVITNMDVSEAEQQVLTDGLQTGNADPQTYAQGIQEAFRLGEMGLSYEQAVDNSTLGDQLNEAQFRHAWEIGARKGGHSTEAQNLSTTRPVNVPEYESIEEFSRDFKSPERVTEIFDSVPETDVNEFAAGFRAAYDMGQSGVSANYLTEANVPTLTTEQAQAAYQLGRQDAETLAVDRDLRTAQRQRTGGNQARVRGSVRGDGVSIADLKRTFNDSQNTAYRLLTRYADTTGVNIVLYNSQADQTTGLFPAAQGRFQWKDDTIYVDINSGLFSTNDVNGLGNYTMLRTFAHEFTHFIEKWNSSQYNEFREFVFQTMEARGQNVHDMIEAKQALDESGNMTYEQASREVVADAMMDILPDSSLVQQLASEHPNVFRTLLRKLREFAARMKQYYRGLTGRITEAETLKENGAYLEDIVQMWDNIAKGAVRNYQGANGEILVDQPAKPENLPRRTSRVQENSKSNPSPAQPETRRAGMDFFRPVETTEEAAPNLRQMAAQRNRPASMDFFREVEVNEEEAPNLAQMAAQRNQPVTRERFPANDFTSQAEEGPDLKGMVPRAEKAPSEAQETQAAEEEPETPAAAETPAAEETGASEARQDTPEGARLRARLEAGNGPVIMNGFEYAVTGWNNTTIDLANNKTGNNVTYTATIRRVDTSGPVPIFDGHRLFDGKFQFKEDAIEALVTIAEESNLLKPREEPKRGSADAFARGDIFNDDKVKEAAGSKAATDIINKMPEAPEPKKKPQSRFSLMKWKNGTPSQKAAFRILMDYLRQGKGLPSKDLYAICDEAFGGTQAEGKYNRKDAYDAMELAVNQYITETMKSYNEGNAETAKRGVEFAQRLLSMLPTQNVRTQEQLDYQQFSTPPSIAFLAAWAANINNQDHVLEPSAGIGGLLSFAKAWGAETTANELSERRYAIIQAMGFDHYFNENAEHIDDILPDDIQPTVVIMNPPFSSTAGRTKSNKTSNAELHINSALDRLADGGRLVAIVGRGMAEDKYSKYWNKVRQEYTIRANIGIDGSNYTKYGTSFDVQIVVIDKVGPQGNAKTITGSYKSLSEVPEVLEGIRNDRSTEVERNTAVERDTEHDRAERGEEQPVRAPMAEADTSDSGRAESGNRADTGRSGESGSTDVQRTKRGAEPVPDAGTSKRGAVEQQRSDKKGPAGTEAAAKGEELRSDTGTDRTASDVQRQSEQPRRGSESEPSRNGQVSADPVTDDGVYTGYRAPEIPIKGSKPHPAVLVESAAMGAVDMPKATYKPQLPDSITKTGALSTEQLVSVTYAGQAHEQKLPNGERRGFFIGDGTGVGKGRTISGIIFDNFEQGRKKAIWISENTKLLPDAIRDWTDISGRGKDDIKDLSTVKLGSKIEKPEGIVFTSYDTVRTKKGNLSRIDQLVDWFGKDFDGVIAFDEAHNMGNLLGKSGSRGKTSGSGKAIAAVELQKRLPNARVVYVSATAATEVSGLAFASRLGLWGKGTAFTDVNDFVSKIGSAGLSAMELVVRDMKSMGMYVARSISYNGVEYDTVQHDLDPIQRQIYNTMSRAWQNTMRSVEQSLVDTGAQHNSQAKQNAIGQYFSAIQRFYNQVLTSMSMPSVIVDMKKQLAAGRSCVLQIVNTNQAAADRQIADIKANGGELEDMDLTPRGTLIDYLMKCYPVTKFEEYEDEDGNVRSRPVTNSKGEPVIDKKAVAKRDALIAEVNQMSIPDGPLEMLFDAFGTENVSEITGRTRRVVPRKQEDGTIKRVEEPRTKSSRQADISAFQNGDKRILVFSAAGGTGASYHADLRAKNQQQRVHYVLQPGWEASKAVQGFGRTHRSNEASAPIYKLVTTDIKGQKRFTSTIARRLDQLGALTKGQRDTGSGMFGASDNLETDLARDSLREFYRRLGTDKLEGINGKEVLQKLGLLEKFTGEYGQFKLDETVSRDISKFLNRILALEVDEQNRVFDAFISIYEAEMDAAIQAGTLDRGMENVKADKIEIVDDKVIHEQEGTGAATHYVQAKVYTKPKVITTVAEAENFKSGFEGIFRTKDGDIRAVYRIADKTTEYGAIVKQYKIQSPNRSKSSVWQERTLNANAELLPKAEWQKAWDEELKKVPEYNEEVKHLLSGSLLPIWNSLPEEGNTKVQRLITDDGKAYLGRIIPADKIDGVLSRFGENRTKEKFTGKSLMQKALKSNATFNLTFYRAKIHRSRVSGEWRLEYEQPQNAWAIQQQYPDMIMERISYTNRFFIPTNEKGEALLDKLLENNPVANVVERGEDIVQYSRRAQPTKTETVSDLEERAKGIEAEGLVQYSRRVRPDSTTTLPDGSTVNTLKFLNDQLERGEVVHTYKTFLELEVNGEKKLYPPMASTQRDENNKKQMANAMAVGEWEESIGNPNSKNIQPKLDKKTKQPVINPETGNYVWQFKLEKETDSAVPAAYNPYQHSSDVVLNDQFSSAYQRPNLVTYECVIPASELTSGYRYQEARADGMIVESKDAVGLHSWKTGDLAGKLKKTERMVYLSRWLMPVRRLENSEVAQKYKEILDKEDTEIPVPFNVVPPALQAELEKAGVPIDYEGNGSYKKWHRGNPEKFPNGKPIVEESTRRAPGLSNREVLSMAADELDSDSLSEAERNALQIFRDNLTRLEEEQDNRQRLGREYKDQQFTKGGSRQEADRIRAAMSVSDSKIKALENRLLSLENKEVLKGVLEKARRVVELEERKRGDENLKRYRERRNESMATRKYRERVRREVETLREWLMRPSNKDQRAHVPAEIQKTVADFIESINFMSKTALRTSGLETTKADERYLKNLRKMRDAIKANVDTQGYSGYADLPEGFVDTFNALITKAEQHIGDSSGVFVVNQMSAAELQQLAQTIRTLRKYIVTMNSFHNNAMFQHAYEAGEDTVQHLSKFQKSKKSGTAYKFMRFDYMRPSYAFEHFGKGGQSIEHEFREGQATQAFLANRIIDFAKKTYTGKEVEKWSKETKTFTTTDGETVTMPITHLMSLYCLNKRPQALTHIYGDGIRVANYKNGKQVELDEGHIVTIEDVQQMIQELTPRQREVADTLQKYMSTETATWGNYVSLARFDVEQFTEENYFPINSDGRYLSTTADESPDNAGLYALLNSSFTKELKENADNRIILYNIFDVFANHTASMTQYRSFALPVLDALKWFNYKNDTTSVRTKLSSAFGAPLDERAGSGAKGYAEQFVINLLKAYNGTSAQGDPYDSLPLKMLHHFNGAAIAYNLRVVIQQPTAITRAAMILSPAKLMKGLGMSAVQMRKLADEMEQHSGIAAWKALGFYDTNISRGLTDLIKQNPGILDRTMEIGTKGAEAADRFTWAAMWYAAKDSVKRSDYRTEEEYFKAVTDLFEEVIYKTQVVDSLLTKAEFLRSKGGIARQMGSFMSEPSATMSMLTDAYFKYTDDLQRGVGRSEAWKRNGGNIAKTAAVYAVGQVILSAMQAVIDAWRDQDDKDPDWLKNYLQKYLAAFKSNVVEEELIFGKIPLVSELYELMKGYLDKFGVFDKLGLDIYGNDTASGLAMYTKYLSKAVEIIAGKVNGDSKYQNYTNYGIVYNLIRAAANLSGVPFATAWREVQDLWNNTVGFFNPRMKLETYRRKVDQTYLDSIQQTGLAKASYEKILDEADKVHGDGNGSIKQDELGAALVAALEEGTITEDQAQAIWETKGWKKTFDGWRGLGSDAKTEAPAASTAGTSTASKRVAFTPTAAPAATSAPATTGARSYDDFKKVPVYDSTAKQAMYGIWETQLQSSMSLDRFMEILTNADTDGNDSIKQDEMGVALMTSLQSGELTFDQCDAIWRTQWNKARSKTFAKWLNG